MTVSDSHPEDEDHEHDTTESSSARDSGPVMAKVEELDPTTVTEAQNPPKPAKGAKLIKMLTSPDMPTTGKTWTLKVPCLVCGKSLV